jgi:hypothetical protein
VLGQGCRGLPFALSVVLPDGPPDLPFSVRAATRSWVIGPFGNLGVMGSIGWQEIGSLLTLLPFGLRPGLRSFLAGD